MKFNIVYADPPWCVKRGPDWNSNGPSKELDYPTMTVQEIMALPVKSVAEKNSHLYLWTINKYLDESFDVIKAWGFKFSCMLTWCKPRHGIGIGGTYVQTTEHLMFARRGTLTAKKRIDTTWFQQPRLAHSVKPDFFRDMIVEVSGDLPRIELFGRKKISGWIVLGDGIDGKDIKQSLCELIAN